jgi:hypothetical protein
MNGPAVQITGHATVLYVKDLQAALAYYRNKLGFSGDFVWGDPPYYACLSRGDAAIHLNSSLPPAATSVVASSARVSTRCTTISPPAAPISPARQRRIPTACVISSSPIPTAIN